MSDKPYQCGCGKMVVEDTGYDSSDQPYRGLFEVGAYGDIIRTHYWREETCL